MKNKRYGVWLAFGLTALLAACGSSSTPESLKLGDASLTVQAGASQTVSVSLTSSGLVGTALLSYEGVPAGVTFDRHDVVLTGHAQTLTLTCTAGASAAPGSYPVTLTATVGSTHASATIALTVTAVPSETGTVALSVHGPDGATFAPVVKVLDASSEVVDSVSAFGDSSIELAPGSYTVTADPVSADGFTYSGTVTGSPLTVTAGQTASASVSYAPTTGALTVSVSGVDGITPSVEVRDAGGAVVQAISTAGTTTLSDLAPGTYTLVAANVSANGYTYAATQSGSPATVSAGQTASASVSYAPTTGTLTVSVSVADGITPSIEVRDAGGAVVQTVSTAGATTLSDLAPGTYTLVAANVSANGYTYAATLTGSPATVSAGQTASASASYAATTGALTVSVSVVDGITPSVEVRDVGGAVVRAISTTGTATLTDLAPGSYTLVAANVSANGYTYAATLTGSPATVSPGQTASASASYAATTGALTVSVSVADGITPSVEVRDAGGAVVQTISTTGTTTLSGLAPGSYTLVAANVSANGYTYSATLTGSPATVSPGQTASASASYAPTTGALTVSVSVADGITPSVEVRDAGGAVVQTISTTGTTTLSGLAPGSYTLVAANVSANSYTYAATLSGSPATVSAGQTASASASYAAVDGQLALTITVTDGITPSVEVRDAGGTVVQTVTALGTTVITGLAPGTYTVDPTEVVVGTNHYAAEGSTATIAAGQQATASVSYVLTDPPSAVDDASTGFQGTAVSLNVLTNDTAGSPAATVVSFGGGSLGGDVTGNPAGASVSLGGDTLSIDSAGNLSLGAGAGVGVYTFQYRLRNPGGTSDATVTVSLCPNLAVGQTFVSTVADVPALCLGATDATQEFTLIPTNHATQSLDFSALATGVQGVSGPPNPIAPPPPFGREASLAPLAALTDRPLTSEPAVVQDNGLPSLAAARAHGGLVRPAMSPQVIPAGIVPSVGDSMSLTVPSNTLCSGTPVVHTATVQAVSAHGIFVSDDQNPAGGFSASDYTTLATQFDIAYSVVDSKFGQITDEDGNGHVVVFVTSAVNQLPVGTDAFSDDTLHPVGLFLTRDVFPTDPIDGCNLSNAGEILYLEAPDPTGALGRVVTVSSLTNTFAPPSFAFALTDLDDAFRRADVTGADFFEERWLSRALGAMALEQVFFAQSAGLQENQNLVVTNLTTGPNASARVAAFNLYVNRDYSRLRGWMQHPQQVGLLNSVSLDSDSLLSQEGLGWIFLRYAKDRLLGANQGAASDTFLSDLVNSNRQGLDNVQHAIGGASVDEWLRDFDAAIYGDDNAFTVDPTYRITSWNLRSLFGALGGFPLQVAALTSGTSDTRTLAAQGSAHFWRAAVPPSTFAPLTFSVQGGFDASKASYVILRTK